MNTEHSTNIGLLFKHTWRVPVPLFVLVFVFVFVFVAMSSLRYAMHWIHDWIWMHAWSTERLTDRQIERTAGGQTDRQIYGQTDRQTVQMHGSMTDGFVLASLVISATHESNFNFCWSCSCCCYLSWDMSMHKSLNMNENLMHSNNS